MTVGESFLALMFMSCLLAFVLAYFLAGRHRRWSERKVALISASPIPGLLMALTAFLVGHAVFTSIIDPETCGVDACAMIMMSGAMGFGAGLTAYIVTLLSAFMGARLSR
jgi:hypothetical protein